MSLEEESSIPDGGGGWTVKEDFAAAAVGAAPGRGGGESSSSSSIAKGGVACPFPWRLHDMLEAVEIEGLTDVVSWQPHGRAFTVHKPNKFVENVLPRCVAKSLSLFFLGGERVEFVPEPT